MIMRRPYSRTATRRAHRLKIREEPRHQPGRLKNKLRRTMTDPITVAARASAEQLAAEYGQGLAADVEAALHA